MKRTGVILVLAIVVAVCVGMFTACDNNESVESNPLQTAYNAIRDFSGRYACVEHASDWSYVYIDTNPYNEDDYFNSSYLYLVEKFNDALDLPDSIYNDMLHTSASDGLQTVSLGKITVKWKYHPDKGLEVSYNYYRD